MNTTRDAVTRDVILDLWPVYASGEASADTRALFESFLANDSEFARILRESEDKDMLNSTIPTLPPDREAQALSQTKKRLHGWDWSMILWLASLSLTFQAFGRIVADTSWDVSPRNFIIMATLAAISWTAYGIRRWWLRRGFYRKNAPPAA